MNDLCTVVNLRREPYDVYIGRGSKWGNPYRITSVHSRTQVIADYLGYFLKDSNLIDSLSELRGKRLGCFCKPERCHGDLLAEMANCSHRGTDECPLCKP